MPKTLQLDAVTFGFQSMRDETGTLQAVVLVFSDPADKSNVVIPFSADAWENFKRQVAADGEVPEIAIAQSLNGVRRMDVPKGM